MTSYKILKEAQSKLNDFHIENLMTLKPFNKRIIALLNALESLVDNSTSKKKDVQKYTVMFLKNLITNIKTQAFL